MYAIALVLALALQASGAPKAATPAPAQPAKPAAASPPPLQPPPQPAQNPASTPTPPSPPPATQIAPAEATPPAAQLPVETYVYRAEGRRDPFVSLIGSGIGVVSRRGEGPGSMTFSEISVRGVLQSRGTLVAMIEGPDKKTYVVHQGDKLADGTITTILKQGIVVVQEVNDPLSLVKTREVRKMLRSIEDAK